MADIYDPGLVARLIEGMDGDYHDGEEVFISVSPGGRGTTSASCTVTLQDGATGKRQVFRVSVTMPEPGDDDYDDEEV